MDRKKTRKEKKKKVEKCDPLLEKLSARGEIETFITKQNHFTDWHQDFQENFTIQLQGVKRWLLKRGAVEEPMLGVTPHYAADDHVTQQNEMKQHLSAQGAAPVSEQRTHTDYRPDDSFFEDAEEILMFPGDVLYFPSGMWHKVQTLSKEDSISINLSLTPRRWGDEVVDFLKHKVFRQPEMRKKIVGIHSEEEWKNAFTAALKEAVAAFQDGKNLPPPLLKQRAGRYNIRDVARAPGRTPYASGTRRSNYKKLVFSSTAQLVPWGEDKETGSSKFAVLTCFSDAPGSEKGRIILENLPNKHIKLIRNLLAAQARGEEVPPPPAGEKGCERVYQLLEKLGVLIPKHA